MKRAAIILGAVAAMSVTGAANAQSISKPSSGFFDWDTRSTPTATNFTAAVWLDNYDVAGTVAKLNAAKALGQPLALNIRQPLTDPQARAIFNNFAIQYVFCDFEASDAVGRTRAIADLVVNSTKSSGAFVGNFNFYPNSGADTTRPGTVTTTAQSFQNRAFSSQYPDSRGKNPTKTGKLMSNEALYPGAPDFKTPQGQIATPNIRSALFTLPIIRESTTEAALPSGDVHIPWVSRFNNYGNALLDSDGNPNASQKGYSKFEFVQNAANPANGQLLSRGDFSAQILHYRLRGADSVSLFEASISSVVGYTRSQARSDVSSGWGNSSVINGIFGRNNFTLANLTSVIGASGNSSGDIASQQQNIAAAGAVWSGVFDKAGTTRRLAILMSNLGTGTKVIDLPNLIGGFHTYNGPSLVGDDDYSILAGQHLLLTFTLTKNSQTGNQLAWLLDSSSAVFTDNNRNGIGIPEPTSLGLLGIGALGLLARRRRHA